MSRANPEALEGVRCALVAGTCAKVFWPAVWRSVFHTAVWWLSSGRGSTWRPRLMGRQMQASSTAWSHRHGTSIRFCFSRPAAWLQNHPALALFQGVGCVLVPYRSSTPSHFRLVSTTNQRSAGDGPLPLRFSSLLDFAARKNGMGDWSAPWMVFQSFSRGLVQGFRDKLRPKRPSCYLNPVLRARGCPWTVLVWYKIYGPNGCLSGLRLEGLKA